MWKTLIAALAAMIWLGVAMPALALSPAEEKQLFTISGVQVDETAPDAAQAKLKAVSAGQVKAFAVLAERLAGESGAAIMATLPPEEVGRLMASLSVESEKIGPGRYIGKLTISFLPAKVREAFIAKGVQVASDQPGAPSQGALAGPILLIPVWTESGEAPVIWDETPLRRALAALDLSGGRLAFRLPLGDTEDWAAFSTPEEADAEKLKPLLARYQAKGAVLVLASRDDKGITVNLTAVPAIPGLAFTKTYPPRIDSLKQAAAEATGAVAQTLEQAASVVPPAPAPADAPPTLNALVALDNADQWPQIRQSILGAPGVQGVDLLQVAQSGVQVRVNYQGTPQDLQMALSSQGLDLLELSTGWEIRPR